MANDQVTASPPSTITAAKLNDITVGTTAPTSPTTGWTWVDTSTTPPTSKVWSGSAWNQVLQPLAPGAERRQPVTVPTGTHVNCVAWNPAGDALAIGVDTSPYLLVYKYSTAYGFTPEVHPATPPAAQVGGVAWSPDGAYIAVTSDTSPYLQVYPWSGTAVGTVVANPVTLPAGAAKGVAWNPAGTFIACGHVTSPFVTMWAWSAGAFGAASTALSGGNLPPGTILQLVWSPTGLSLIGSSDTTPYVAGWPVSGAGVWGTKFTAPVTTPGATGYGVSMNAAGTLIAVTTANSPRIQVYAISDTAFGAKVTNPALLPGGAIRRSCWWESGSVSLLIVENTAAPWWIVYGMTSSGFSGGWRTLIADELLVSNIIASYGALTGQPIAPFNGIGGVAGWPSMVANPVNKHLAFATNLTPFLYVIPPDVL